MNFDSFCDIITILSMSNLFALLIGLDVNRSMIQR